MDFWAMGWKNQLTKTPYLVLFIILITFGVGTASALTITLGADLIEFLGILDMNFNRISNVGTPTADTDAATKAYVDQASSTDTLASLGCATDQIAKFDGNSWICGKQIALHNPITTVDSTLFIDFETSIAIGTDNNPVISYNDNSLSDLRVAHCGNPTCSAGNTITVIDGLNIDEYSSIAIGTDNNPVISYFLGTPTSDLKVAHCGNPSCSAGNTITTVFSTLIVGQHNSIAIGTDNNPVISFYDNSNDDLKVAHCNDISCSTTPNITTVDASTDDVGTFTSIAIGSDNFPVISYVDNTNNDLKVVHCGHIACLGFNTITIVDSSGLVDGETSIAIGSDGLPVIGYAHNTAGGLKFVHCGNTLCNSDNTITTIDNVALPGYVSVAIGRNNNPVISYWDGINEDLKVAHCGNKSCSAVNSISIVDGANDVGRYTSIAIGADNNPVISYVDFTNSAIKVAVDGTVLIFE